MSIQEQPIQEELFNQDDQPLADVLHIDADTPERVAYNQAKEKIDSHIAQTRQAASHDEAVRQSKMLRSYRNQDERAERKSEIAAENAANLRKPLGGVALSGEDLRIVK